MARPIWTLTSGNGALFPAAAVDTNKAQVRTWLTEAENALSDLYDKNIETIGAIGGTANAITGTLTPALDAYAAGQTYWLTPASTNTAAATLNINGLGAKNLFTASGLALVAGELTAARTVQIFYDGTQFRVVGDNLGDVFKMLFADDAGGQNVATVQPWFPTAGGVTVPASGTYFFDGFLWLSRAAGAVSHTTSLQFGGTATLNSIDGYADVETGDVATLAATARVGFNSAAAVVAKAASTAATEQFLASVKGILRINGAGTFIPQFIYSVAPGGAPTVKRGSFFSMRKIPDNATASRGAWA